MGTIGSLVCEHCGVAFVRPITTGPRAKYCGEGCRRAADSQRVSERRRGKREKREAEHDAARPRCQRCGEPVKSAQKRFCSRLCANREHLLGKTTSHPERICMYCGQTFRPKEASRLSFCSRECAFAHKHARSVARKEAIAAGIGECCSISYWVCSECGLPFVAKNQYERTVCSTECAMAKGRRLYQAYATKRKVVAPAVCAECGQEFTAPYGDKRRTYCSHECAHRHLGRISKGTRRARLRDCETEKIDPLAVFERDGWRCGICGKKVSRHLKCPHPRSVSLDHIIPLALGGSHTWDNVQCAHRACNGTKRDGDGGQLRLQIRVGGIGVAIATNVT